MHACLQPPLWFSYCLVLLNYIMPTVYAVFLLRDLTCMHHTFTHLHVCIYIIIWYSYFNLHIILIAKSPSCCGTDSKKSIECDLKNQAITKLKVKYIKVVNKIKQTMEEKHFDVDELIMNLSAADEDNHTVFSTDVAYNTIKTIPDLFKKIGQYCSVYDYELLQVLVESVDCEEAIKLLEGFTEELNNSIINELDLLRIFQEQPKPTQLMPGTHKLVIKYTGNICTLPMKNMIQRVVFECFKLKPGSVILRGIEEGCIALIYQISAAVKSYLLHYKLGHQEFTLLATHKIKCVIVDGTEIQVPPEFLEKVCMYSVVICANNTFM